MARLSLTYGYIVLENKSVSDSIQESWRMTDEHGGRLFGLTLSFVALTIIFSLIIDLNIISIGVDRYFGSKFLQKRIIKLVKSKKNPLNLVDI